MRTITEFELESLLEADSRVLALFVDFLKVKQDEKLQEMPHTETAEGHNRSKAIWHFLDELISENGHDMREGMRELWKSKQPKTGKSPFEENSP